MSSNLFEAEVLSVHHWTDRLFSFTTTRDPGFRYQSGQFTMIGLNVEGKPCCAPTAWSARITRNSWNS